MNKDLPDLKQFALFLKVVDEKGVGRAAKALNMSQPFISQEIARIEERLGHRLFDRAGSKLCLTVDGEALVVFARSMLALAERTRSYFAKPRSKGPIRIGLTEELARVGLFRVLMLFAETQHGFRLEVETDFSSSALVKAVREGRLDLVVGKSFKACGPSELLWREPMVWYGRPGSKVAPGETIPIAVAGGDSEIKSVVFAKLNEAGVVWTVAFQSASYACLEAAVLGGFAIAPGAACLGAVPGVEVLNDDCLPSLPDVSFFIESRPSVSGVAEFETALRDVLVRLR